MKSKALSLGNIILLKEKWGMRESIPRQIDKKSRGPQGERSLDISRSKKGQTFPVPLHYLELYNNNVFCLRVVSGIKPSGSMPAATDCTEEHWL